MKRKDMILKVSLDLFNAQGESNVTSVDIANELEISPGNLYYHFKGKEQIVAALVRKFTDDIAFLIAASHQPEQKIVGRWMFVYILLEEIYLFRFLFRNIQDVVYNYPEPGKALLRVLEQLQANCQEFIVALAEKEEINISPVQKNLIQKLVNSIMLVIVYWESYQVLRRRVLSETEFVQDASLQMLSLISPYLNDEQIRDIHQSHQQYLREKVANP